MKILLTGAFGNIGMSTLQELLRQGHQVRCFVIQHLKHIIGYKRLLTGLVSPIARWWILRMSPFYQNQATGAMGSRHKA